MREGVGGKAGGFGLVNEDGKKCATTIIGISYWNPLLFATVRHTMYETRPSCTHLVFFFFIIFV